MRDCRTFEIELHQVLLGLLDGLADGHGNFARLAHAEAGVPALIAHDNKRREAKILAALHDFCDAIDRDDLIFQVGLVSRQRPANGKRVFEFLFGHDQNFTPASRAASASACTRPWYW